MADILVRGMEMPKTCQICRTAKFDRIVGCEEWDRLSIAQRMYMRSETCPLVPLPEGHGRLGDLDALDKFLAEREKEAEAEEFYLGESWYNTFRQILRKRPTIVPAEGGNNE